MGFVIFEELKSWENKEGIEFQRRNEDAVDRAFCLYPSGLILPVYNAMFKVQHNADLFCSWL